MRSYFFVYLLLPYVSLSSCSNARTSSTGLIGAYTPQCDSSNPERYTPLQCHGSSGYCWCVDVYTGEKKGIARPSTSMIFLDCDI